ncbi:MAG: hypothetical protein Kow0092_28000 [Deferrisomatales bacterium]
MTRWGFGLLYAALALAVAALGAYLAVAFLVERAPEVEVPEVAGLTLSEALDRLAPAGLDLEVRAFVYSDEIAENRVVRQSPAPGRVVKAGRGVGVVISRGPERHPAPDLRGLPLEDARILLGEARLQGTVAVRLPDGPEGTVVGQGAAPGRRLPAGATLALAVSAGPRPVRLRMPRLEGLTRDDAVGRLDALGVRVERIEEVSLEDPSRAGRVVSQDPLPGFPVVRGGAATLSVAGRASRRAPVDALWLAHALPPGFGRHRVEAVVEGGPLPWTAADRWVGGGEVVRLWVPLRAGEHVRLRVDGEEVGLSGPSRVRREPAGTTPGWKGSLP